LVKFIAAHDLQRLAVGTLNTRSPLTGFSFKRLNDELFVLHTQPPSLSPLAAGAKRRHSLDRVLMVSKNPTRPNAHRSDLVPSSFV
jgi:hypothetical protein